MSFLYLLESIRNPFLNVLLSALTWLGSELAFMVLALVLYWCLDKRRGMLVLAVGFGGTIISEFMKLAFRIPRPWLKDPNFTIVESARSEAAGYSFPSGHTQTAVSCYGSLGCLAGKRRQKLLCAALIVITGFSRMYLGVHTPADVAVGLLIGLLMLALIVPLFRRYGQRDGFLYGLLGVMLVLSIAYVIYMECHSWPADIDPDNLQSGVKNGWSLTGACAAMLLSVWLDKRFLHFKTEAPLPGQILKVALGLALSVAVKTVLKQPLLTLFGGSNASHCLRYFLLVLFAAVVWPLTFPFWAKVGKKQK